jgi:hypothetical protein
MDTVSNVSETRLDFAPVSGDKLFRLEVERRKTLHRRGSIPTGCAEIDDALLLSGGFERGCVVGVSAEDMNLGLLVSFVSFFLSCQLLRKA